jgi:hypothetical protein
MSGNHCYIYDLCDLWAIHLLWPMLCEIWRLCYQWTYVSKDLSLYICSKSLFLKMTFKKKEMTIRKGNLINHVRNNPNDRVKIVFNCRKKNITIFETCPKQFSRNRNIFAVLRLNLCQWLMSLSFFYYKLNLKNKTIKPKTFFDSFVD